MANFYVGQRVRFLRVVGPKRRSSKYRWFEGHPCVIEDIKSWPESPERFCSVRFDNGKLFGVMRDQIEPITNIDQTPAELTVE